MPLNVYAHIQWVDQGVVYLVIWLSVIQPASGKKSSISLSLYRIDTWNIAKSYKRSANPNYNLLVATGCNNSANY